MTVLRRKGYPPNSPLNWSSSIYYEADDITITAGANGVSVQGNEVRHTGEGFAQGTRDGQEGGTPAGVISDDLSSSNITVQNNKFYSCNRLRSEVRFSR